MVPGVLLAAGTPLAVKVLVGAAGFGIAAVALKLIPVRDARNAVSHLVNLGLPE
jgi:hypothetical protein